MEKEILKFNQTYHAPIEKVWRALTDQNQMREWYFPQMPQFKPEVGFETEFTVAHNNKNFIHIWKVIQADAPNNLSYEWQYGVFPGRAVLTFNLQNMGAETGMILTFEITDSFRPDENPDLALSNFKEGWTHFIKALAEFLDR